MYKNVYNRRPANHHYATRYVDQYNAQRLDNAELNKEQVLPLRQIEQKALQQHIDRNDDRPIRPLVIPNLQFENLEEQIGDNQPHNNLIGEQNIVNMDPGGDGNQNAGQNRLKISEFLPQPFYGKVTDDPYGHTLQFDDYCRIQNIAQDAEKIAKFKLTLA